MGVKLALAKKCRVRRHGDVHTLSNRGLWTRSTTQGSEGVHTLMFFSDTGCGVVLL